MGAEGYLTLAKVQLPGSPDWAVMFTACGTPVFEVREPVAIYPARATVLGCEGCYHTNLEIDCPTVTQLAMCGHAQVLTLWLNGRIIAGLAVVSQAKWLTATSLPHTWSDPGGVPIEEAREAWAKITPGVWIVKEYREHPADPGRCMTYETPPGCRLGEEVEWMLWT